MRAASRDSLRATVFLCSTPLVVALAFAVTETWVVHLQTRREAQTVSVSEFPLVLGLFFASPAQLLIGRLLGSALIFLVHRRSSPLKTCWNLALLSLQTAVTVALFHVITAGHGADSPLSWLGAYAGAIAANCLGHVAIALVIAIYEAELGMRALLRSMVTDEIASPVVIALSTFLTKVRTRDSRARLMAVRFSVWRRRFSADL